MRAGISRIFSRKIFISSLGILFFIMLTFPALLVHIPMVQAQSNVAGTWSGSITMADTGPPSCTYAGTSVLALTQNGNDVEGTLTDTLHITSQSSYPCDPVTSGPIQLQVQGTVGSSSISLTDNSEDAYSGTFTTGTMKLNVASISQTPPSGAACALYCGYTQVITLTRSNTVSQPTSATSSRAVTASSSLSSSTTISPSSTESCNVVNPSEHILICVPSWLSGSSTGSVSVTNPGGVSQSFTGTLPLGDGLTTGSGSYANVVDNDAQSTVTAGPLSKLQAWFPAFLSIASDASEGGAGTIYTCENSPSNCDLVTAHTITGATSEALEAAFQGNLPMAWYYLGKGVYDATIDVTSGIRTAATCLGTANAVGCDSAGSDAAVTVGSNGTEFDVLSGSWVIINFASGQSVTLTAGQKTFVSNDTTLAAQQNMTSSVGSFNPSTFNQWWIVTPPPPGPDYAIIGPALVLVVVLVAISGVFYARRRSQIRKKDRLLVPPKVVGPAPITTGNSTTQNPVFPSPVPIRPIGAQPTSRFCRYCGSAVSPQAPFCSQCGEKLSLD